MASATHWTKNDTYSAAYALNAGMDLNSNIILPTQLRLAIELGLTNETILDASLARTLTWRFRVGQMDPLEHQPWLSYGVEHLSSPDDLAAAMEGAAQGLVLVKNAGGVLPLTRGKKITVLGPLADAQEALLGDYYADAVCSGADGYSNSVGYGCVPSLATSLRAANTGGSVVTFPGVTMKNGNDSSWGAAIASISTSDVVVLALGTDRSVAGEATDRTDIGLPGLQSPFGLAVLAAAAAAEKPVVFILLSSFPVSFDELVNSSDAIVLAYAPAFGSPAIAAAMFGVNRWGRAVLTHYPHLYQSAVELGDFSMTPSASNAGRSYRCVCVCAIPPALPRDPIYNSISLSGTMTAARGLH